ncbi:MAG: hypothetical protein CM15mP77_1990 [Synechococcus sp.]|nr:MAG: hypothetical protein CM15mP77_1990 [Synechococcus sp.]
MIPPVAIAIRKASDQHHSPDGGEGTTTLPPTQNPQRAPPKENLYGGELALLHQGGVRGQPGIFSPPGALAPKGLNAS